MTEESVKNFSCRAILVVKNEEDIIEAQISHLQGFCAAVYVLDNGSTDKTAEIVSRLVSENVVYLGSLALPFFDNMRNWLWRLLKDQASDGDWWLLADADEFFEDDVLEFLAQVPEEYGVILKRQIYPIPVAGQESAFEALEKPDFDFFTNYYPSSWAEPRFFRHTRKLTLSVDTITFSRARAVFPVAIRLKHYNWRTAKQVSSRIETRRQLSGKSVTDFRHMEENSWQEVLVGKYAAQALPFASGVRWPEEFQNWRPYSRRDKLRRFGRVMLARLGLI